MRPGKPQKDISPYTLAARGEKLFYVSAQRIKIFCVNPESVKMIFYSWWHHINSSQTENLHCIKPEGRTQYLRERKMRHPAQKRD